MQVGLEENCHGEETCRLLVHVSVVILHRAPGSVHLGQWLSL